MNSAGAVVGDGSLEQRREQRVEDGLFIHRRCCCGSRNGLSLRNCRRRLGRLPLLLLLMLLLLLLGDGFGVRMTLGDGGFDGLEDLRLGRLDVGPFDVNDLSLRLLLPSLENELILRRDHLSSEIERNCCSEFCWCVV